MSPDQNNPTPAARRSWWSQVLKAVLALGLAAVILLVALPNAFHTGLEDIQRSLAHVGPLDMAALTLLWVAGLFTHSWVLTGSLLGLSTRRAMTLNLTGSAVANVMPFGGAVGMSLNYYMLRRWKMSPTQFASYQVVSNLWNVLMKLSMPALALAAVYVTGTAINHRLVWSAGIGAAALLLLVTLIVVGLANARAAKALAQSLATLIAAPAAIFKRDVDCDKVITHTMATRDMVAEVIRTRWRQISTAMTGYGLLQGVLLYACLHTVGAGSSIAAALAAYAVDRLLSIIPITPAGAGFTEVGMTAILIAMGADPASSAAGVLLYRAFTAALEVPVGGIWLAGWFTSWWHHDRRSATPGRA